MSTLNEARQALIDAVVVAAHRGAGEKALAFTQALQMLHYVEPTIPDAPAVVDERDPDGKVLAWVNGIRAAYDLGEPLDALPPDALPAADRDESICTACPIGRAVASCSYKGARIDGNEVRFPDFVREFQIEHDRRIER